MMTTSAPSLLRTVRASCRSGATHGANVLSIIVQRMAAMSATGGPHLDRRRYRGLDQDSLLAAMCALEERQMKAAGAGFARQGVQLVDSQHFQVVDLCMPALRADYLEG